MIIDGKKISEKVLNEVKIECDKLKESGITPSLAVILVGNNEASKIYVRNKSKACEKVGINYKEYNLDENVNEDELFDLIKTLNEDPSINGILLQSPVPKHIDIEKAFDLIDPKKDVDGFNSVNLGSLLKGNEPLTSCTSVGIIRLLDEYNIPISGKNVTVVGRSTIVGKPLSLCLLNRDATVTICHSKTKDLKDKTLSADILISAVGKQNTITENMIKDDAIVIDVGINKDENGKTVGDVNPDAKNKCSYITPVPGGVGPMTVAYLTYNVIKATKMQIS